MNAADFREWVLSLPIEDQEKILLFVVRLVMDVKYPDMTMGKLRKTIKFVYESQPNPTWTMFLEELKEV